VQKLPHVRRISWIITQLVIKMVARSLNFCLVTVTQLVSKVALNGLARALEANGKHCADVWGLNAPAFDAIDAERGLPSWGSAMLFLDGSEANPEALAQHWFDKVRGMPASRVFCDRSSGLNKGRYSIDEASSHEGVESLCNPRLDLWTDMPGRIGVQVPIEVGDPVQTHYVIRINNRDWRMANFVTPDWFRSDLADPRAAAEFLLAGGRFDYLGELSYAGEIGPEGYVVLREPDLTRPGKYRYWQETRRGVRDATVLAAMSEHDRAAATHQLSRSVRIMTQ